MVLKLSGHVRNTISLLYKQKSVWNSNINLELFSKNKNGFFLSILVYFHWKFAFWVQPCLKTSLWRHTLTDFHDFDINGKRRPYPIPWYQTIILRAPRPPLVNHVTKKGLVGRGLNLMAAFLVENGTHSLLSQPIWKDWFRYVLSLTANQGKNYDFNQKEIGLYPKCKKCFYFRIIFLLLAVLYIDKWDDFPRPFHCTKQIGNQILPIRWTPYEWSHQIRRDSNPHTYLHSYGRTTPNHHAVYVMVLLQA